MSGRIFLLLIGRYRNSACPRCRYFADPSRMGQIPPRHPQFFGMCRPAPEGYDRSPFLYQPISDTFRRSRIGNQFKSEEKHGALDLCTIYYLQRQQGGDVHQRAMTITAKVVPAALCRGGSLRAAATTIRFPDATWKRVGTSCDATICGQGGTATDSFEIPVSMTTGPTYFRINTSGNSGSFGGSVYTRQGTNSDDSNRYFRARKGVFSEPSSQVIQYNPYSSMQTLDGTNFDRSHRMLQSVIEIERNCFSRKARIQVGDGISIDGSLTIFCLRRTG